MTTVETENVSPEKAILRVAAKSPTSELASAISHAVYDGKKVEVRAIGAGAVNQAVKGIIVASGYIAQRGGNLVTKPGFTEVEINGAERSAIVFNVFTL